MKNVLVSNVGHAMLTREFALCLFTNCDQALSLCSPYSSPVRCKILALIVLESPKFGESLSLDNIIFNVILFSDIKTTTTQCTTENKFILFPVHN